MFSRGGSLPTAKGASTERAIPTYSATAESNRVRKKRQEAIMAGELAVVLSGGGAKGAFQVGVLDELITNRGVKVDIAVGTSTGSIQALAVAQDDIPKLLQMWRWISCLRVHGICRGLLHSRREAGPTCDQTQRPITPCLCRPAC